MIKLLDFGLVQRVGGMGGEQTVTPSENAASGKDLAAQLTPDALALQVTRVGSLLGTPAFMSPEQILARGALDARSDIYSLGCVAYFLLTGRPPFLGEAMIDVLTGHLTEPPTPLASYELGVSADLAAVIARCLEKKPEQRYADVTELGSALTSCVCAAKWDSAKAADWWHQHRARAATPPQPEAAEVDGTLDAAPITPRMG